MIKYNLNQHQAMLWVFSYTMHLMLSIICATKNSEFYFTNEEIQKFTIEENQPEKTFVGKVKFGKNLEDDFQFSFTEKSQLFDIDPKTGDIATTTVVDLEKLCPGMCPEKTSASIPLTVSLKKDNNLVSMVKVIITVLDVDDNFPEFDQQAAVIEVKEVIYKKNQIINLPTAIDRDVLLKNREINYKISGDCSAFILEETKYKGPKLRLLEDLDYETKADYWFTLFAYHKFEDRMSANLSVHIKVININDCTPQFALSQYDISINEDVPVDEIIIQINATDPDGDSLKYSMQRESKHFQIRNNGDIYVSQPLDFEKQRSYSFTIRAFDGEFEAETNLHIEILDVNDEAPMYTLNPPKLVINETDKVGILVGQITVFDRDSPSVNKGLRCTEPNSNGQALRFTSDSSSNENILIYKLYTIHALDRESIPSGVLYTNLICYDSGTNRQLHQKISIPLFVNDINDNAPYFSSPKYHVGVKENNEIGYRFYQMSAKDADPGINGKISYGFGTSLDSDVFQIDTKSGWIKVVQSLDRETKMLYSLTIIAYDQAVSGRRSGSTTLIVNVLDDNDNAPQLLDSFELSIKENLPLGTFVGTLRAFDKDDGHNARVTFQLTFKGSSQPFEVYENGSVFTNQVFDREKQGKVCTQIQLSDSSETNVLTSQNAVCVTVIDENDNYPQIFLYENDKMSEIKSMQNISVDRQLNIDFVLEMSVRESPGFVLAIVKARDEDANNNSQLSYYLENIDSDREIPSIFDVNLRSGSIFLNRPLHRDYIGTQKWKIVVEDSGTPPLKSAKNIMIKILDIPSHQSRTETSKHKPASKSLWIGNNFMIAVTLSVISAVLILLLISAIVCIVKPCHKNRDRFRNQSYQSNFVPNLMFHDQIRQAESELGEKSKFEISENMDGLWGGNMMKQHDLRMICEVNCKSPIVSSTPNEYFLHNGSQNPHICDFNTNTCNYPIYNVPGSLKLLLRNDEQRSDSGKGASDDDMSYIPKFVNDTIHAENNDIAGPLTYNHVNSMHYVQFPTYMFNCPNPNSQSVTDSMQTSKIDYPYPILPTHSSTNI